MAFVKLSFLIAEKIRNACTEKNMFKSLNILVKEILSIFFLYSHLFPYPVLSNLEHPFSNILGHIHEGTRRRAANI